MLEITGKKKKKEANLQKRLVHSVRQQITPLYIRPVSTLTRAQEACPILPQSQRVPRSGLNDQRLLLDAKMKRAHAHEFLNKRLVLS